MEKNEDHFISDAEWENRTLCSDESCIGVIGPDGRCKECGRPFDGELPETVSPPEAVDEKQTTSSETVAEESYTEEARAGDDNDTVVADAEWENRILCSDESCIGVIGPDGRCKECGRPYEGE